MKFYEFEDDADEIGKPFTGAVRVNGYTFGDKLLEDVYFHADMVNADVPSR